MVADPTARREVCLRPFPVRETTVSMDRRSPDPTQEREEPAGQAQPRDRLDELDEVVLLEDLAPRKDVGGGRKLTLGESAPEDR